MVVERSKEEQEKPKRITTNFRTSSLFVRRSFIIGMIVLFLAAVYTVTSGFLLHFGALPANIICSFTIALALSGIILGSISFRTSRNIYAIIGIVVDLVVIGFLIFEIIVANRVA